jgi:hypothetical protein
MADIPSGLSLTPPKETKQPPPHQAEGSISFWRCKTIIHNARTSNKDIEIDKRPMDYLYTSFLQPFQKLVLKKTNSTEIEEIIRLIKPKSAHGYDGITIKLIKASTIYIITINIHM